MERLQELSEKVSLTTVYIGGSLLIFSAFLVAVEVIMRKVFSQSLAAVDEVSGYIFAFTTTWALSYALFRRAHIRIDALYVRLPAKVQCTLDVVALLSLAMFFTLLAWQAVGVLTETVRIGATSNTPLRTPLWMPQILWLTGYWFFLFNIYLLLIRAAWALFTARFDEVRQIAGAPSLLEEVAEEIHLSEAAHKREQDAAQRETAEQNGGRG
jgi:TRAP-type mannitol/chloroaromatic compound transport system permease small subunit